MGTGIQWTDETWNPVTGCDRVSPGCAHCYAAAIAKRFWGDRKFEDVQFHPERLGQPLRWRKPRRVFVDSMGDIFHESVTDEQLDRIFAVMALTQEHTYQVLTKRPERMLEYCQYLYGSFDKSFDRIDQHAVDMSGSPCAAGAVEDRDIPFSNIWLGVSVENQAVADKRIPLLLQTPAAVRFLSCEPLLGEVDLGLAYSTWKAPWNSRWVELPFPVRGDLIYESTVAKPGYYRAHSNKNGALSVPAHNGREESLLGIKPDEFEPLGTVDWVIVGGESGPKARECHLPWIQNIVEQCAEAGVACFTKQTGSNPWQHDCQQILVTGKGSDTEEWARLGYNWPRQFPTGVETA